MFSAGAIRQAKATLDRVEAKSGNPVVIIETVETLGGEPADRFAVEHARRSGIRGVFILIARKEQKLEVLGSGRYREILTADHRKVIRDAFFEGFRRQDFNAGLTQGTEAIARVIATALDRSN
jgi:uncharacterized membrane protein YgcG